jgi:putative Holliday junction resolvase
VRDVEPAPSGPVLGFDVGSRRIGVAVGNALSGSSRALTVVAMISDVPDWPVLDGLVKEWTPLGMVVGDPRELDDEQAMPPARARARRFAGRLAARYRLPVWLVDERSSSVEAARDFAAARAAGVRRRKQADQLDALAAAIILERWLQSPHDSQTWHEDSR